MEYTKGEFIKLIKKELARLEGQLAEHDITKEEYLAVETVLGKVGELFGVNIWTV